MRALELLRETTAKAIITVMAHLNRISRILFCEIYYQDIKSVFTHFVEEYAVVCD